MTGHWTSSIDVWMPEPYWEDNHGASTKFYRMPPMFAGHLTNTYGFGWSAKLHVWVVGREQTGDVLPPDFCFSWELLDRILRK